MQDQFIHIARTLFSKNDKLLLACSGGADSIALFHLLKMASNNFSVAHVNYQLRGEESDKDARFIKQLCAENKIPFFIKKVSFDKDRTNSIQEEARDIRYQFFDEIIEKNKFDYILTAHHQGDLAENVVFRMMRGSGLKGLVSFTEKEGNLIRPLLSYSKDDILYYIAENNIKFREDSSNSTNKYARNKIRNKILPLMEENLPNINFRITKTKKLLKSDFDLIQTFINPYKKKLMDGKIVFSCKHGVAQQTSFWHYLLETNEEEANQIAEAVKNQKNGFSFQNETIELSIIQNQVEITKKESLKISEVFISEAKSQTIHLGNNELQVQFGSASKAEFKEGSCVINADNLIFPLCIRNPKTGDKFQPLGMQGSKLLSDFYNDLGIAASEKTKQIVLADANAIILAVLPFRIDDRYKITKTTKKVCRIDL